MIDGLTVNTSTTSYFFNFGNLVLLVIVFFEQYRFPDCKQRMYVV